MDVMCATDITAIIALFIAVIVPAMQGIFGRRREWHDACHYLCTDLSSLFNEINSLLLAPSKVNHISFQYYLKQRITILDLNSKRFPLQKNRIKKAKNIIITQLMELPKSIEYERLLQLGEKEKRYHYMKFCEDVRNSILAVSEVLIK